MTNTLKERTQNGKALGLNGNGLGTQSLGNGQAGTVYCPTHGLVKSWQNECELCVDAGWLDFDATRVAKLLIPDWTGIKTDGRKVFVARVRDALDAVEKISLYKNSDAIVLIVWDSLVTPLDNGKIGLSWTLSEVAETLEVECVACGQPFAQTWGNEQICESCALGEL
jgi:hypothetical protein